MYDLRPTIDRVKEFRGGILERLRQGNLQSSLADVRRVVVINASSRSGSSLLHTLLSRLPEVCSLTGEATSFYRLNTCHDEAGLSSDRIPTDLLDRVIDAEGLARDLLADLHRAGEMPPPAVDLGAYADRLILRFSLQWPAVRFDVETFRSCVERAFSPYSSGDRTFATAGFYLDLLGELRGSFPQVNPYYYDLAPEAIASRFPSLEIPVGPPHPDLVIEEPPFVLESPRWGATREDLSDRVLLLKSTVDCYRMNLIERLFPAADIRIVHLVRNPAAATNGICDGWLHRGFFSHNLKALCEGMGNASGLRIKGYSDRFPFGRWWWNFDLPEGWERVADHDLLDVCAFQWQAANEAVLAYLAAGKPSCTVRFEDLVASPRSRHDMFERLLDFMKVPPEQLSFLRLDDLPVVQSTRPPCIYRWRERSGLLERLVANREIRELTLRLGYSPDRSDEWL